MGTGEPSGIEALTMLGIYEARYEDLETRLGLASSSPGVVMFSTPAQTESPYYGFVCQAQTKIVMKNPQQTI